MPASVSQFKPPMSTHDPFAMPIDPPCPPAADVDAWRRLNGVDALAMLVSLHGAAAVQTWLRFIAAKNGEAL